jgi:peptidyl-prolyl cis-trans isomerase D
MSVLESIRKRAGIFVVIAIGASMLVFILEDALTSGRFFFSNNENVVATANGKKLDYPTLNSKIEELVNIQKESREVEALDNQTYNQTVQTAYQDMVANMVLDPQCKKLGISVPDSEMADLLLGSHPSQEVVQYFTDPNTGRLYKELVDPRTGGINMSMVVQYVKQMDEKRLAGWTLLEYQVKDRQYQAKYFNLLRNGLYVTDAQAKETYENENKYYNISYILKKYSDVADNSITVSDQDIQSYYNEHQYEYNQSEESRKIDYVSFVAAPTDKDLSDLQASVDTIASSFKKSKVEEDSAFIVAESDDHAFDTRYHKHGKLGLDPAADSILCSMEKGKVLGPNKDGGEYKIYKVIDVAQLPDSSKLRIIALPGTKDDMTKAKALADSLKKVVTAENFAEMAQKYSQDGSAQKGGDIGWLHEDKVPQDILGAGFFSDKGDIKEIPSQGAYLLVFTEDQSPKEKYVKLGIITKKIGPSTETVDAAYAKASAFSGKHSTTEGFEKDADGLNKRIADLKENDQTVPGITSPKELVRWAYSAKSGDVSNAFDVGDNHYVVAHIMEIRPLGTTPLALVKDDVKQKALQDKKAQKLIADMKTMEQATANIATLGQKAGVQPVKAQRLLFQTYSIPGLGKEDALLGTMAGLKPQTLSQPIEGQLGVYVIQVDSVYLSGTPNYQMVKEQQQSMFRTRVEYSAFSAMEKKAGLVSHLGKFY